jgi:metabolite-proton symporter
MRVELMTNPAIPSAPTNSTRRVLFASLIGTTIEFFDFYIYATAAVIVFPKLFFPSADPASAVLQSFATFSIAFFARPFGAVVFGHFGDRVGRKATLVAALMTMGLSTVAIGLLPTYAGVGLFAPLLLALCRMGQGLGLGGEWGGAVLLATENAPKSKRAWFGMFPQLGAPVGFILANGSFILLSRLLSDAQFLAWGWRIPFVASSLLVLLGLWVRLSLTETPDFQRAIARQQRVKVPIAKVLAEQKLLLLLGTVGAISTFVLFYIMTVFALNWGTTALGYPKSEFLPLQMGGVLFFGLMIPVSAVFADRFGYARTLTWTTAAIIVFGLVLAPIFGSGSELGAFAFLAIGFSLMGFTYGPLGTALAEPFPTAVRYTGASMTFNLAGIFGASLAPYIATTLATTYGLSAVGWYLCGASCLTLLALLALERKTASSGDDDALVVESAS